MKKNKIKIVDYFPFFGPTGKELLELRVEMLKDYVDQFIICESNKTQSGLPIEYELKGLIKELNLPEDKIRIIELDIPEADDIIIEDIDRQNCTENYKPSVNQDNINSLRARVRERLQKDALLSIIDEYDNDTIFIHSDSDEIINPKKLDYILNIVKENPSNVYKINSVLLEGRADLVTYDISTDRPKLWHGMFITTKKILSTTSPITIRSGLQKTHTTTYLSKVDNEELSWHFSWMGDAKLRDIKRKAFMHYDDKLSIVLDGAGYNTESADKFFNDYELMEGSVSPSGITDSILKKYPIEKLPSEVFSLPRVKEFLLPTTGMDFVKNKYETFCNAESNINKHLPVLHSLAKECSHITEFGVGFGLSSSAFLLSNATVRSYDIVFYEEADQLFKYAKQDGRDCEYVIKDDLTIDIDETDLLFIDSYHSYDQLQKELSKHINKVKKYIVFHDTYSFGLTGQSKDEKGLLQAVIECVIENPMWKFKYHTIDNNGLTILENTNRSRPSANVIPRKISKFNLKEALLQYIEDPFNSDNNFELGLKYESMGHLSAACSFFLRAAEFSKNDIQSYVALVRLGLCIEKSGNRVYSTEGVYLRAISLLPNRPEAFFLLCRLYERSKKWNECYTLACEGELLEQTTSLRHVTEYPGTYGFTYEKAVSSWWIGRYEQSYSIFKELETRKDIDAVHMQSIKNNILNLNNWLNKK
jgi:hypothetical protein